MHSGLTETKATNSSWSVNGYDTDAREQREHKKDLAVLTIVGSSNFKFELAMSRILRRLTATPFSTKTYASTVPSLSLGRRVLIITKFASLRSRVDF